MAQGKWHAPINEGEVAQQLSQATYSERQYQNKDLEKGLRGAWVEMAQKYEEKREMFQKAGKTQAEFIASLKNDDWYQAFRIHTQSQYRENTSVGHREEAKIDHDKKVLEDMFYRQHAVTGQSFEEFQQEQKNLKTQKEKFVAQQLRK